MAYYDSRYSSAHNDSYHSRPQQPDRYSNVNQGSYDKYRYDPRFSRSGETPPSLPPRPSSQYSYPDVRRPRRQWPPAPSVEDEVEALRKEFPTAVSFDDSSNGEAKSRGSIDQYPIIQDLSPPDRPPHLSDDKRYVLVSDPKNDDSASRYPAASKNRESRRRSFAERGNMAHLNTDLADPPVFTERTPTPYAYTKPSKESVAPSAGQYRLSPEKATPTSSSIPRSIPRPDRRETQRDQNVNPAQSSYVRYNPRDPSPRPSGNDTFADSDIEVDDATLLRAERKPARYSFVKDDFKKEDLRTDLREMKRERRDSRPPARHSPTPTYDDSFSGRSNSSKHSTPPSQSPKSSTSSLTNGSSRPNQTSGSTYTTSYAHDSARYYDPRPKSRPSSPLPHERRASPSTHLPRGPSRTPPSPHLRASSPPTRQNTYPTSRPTSRGGSRPPTPSSCPTGLPQIPITHRERERDRYSTYPPVRDDRSRQHARFARHDTAPVPAAPRIDVQSPSPARPPYTTAPLPYPVDDRSTAAFMPPEEAYQVPPHYDMPSAGANYRQPYPEEPMMPSPPAMESPRDFRSPMSNPYNFAGEVPNLGRMRSDSNRSQFGNGTHTPAGEVPYLARTGSNSGRSHFNRDVRQPERKPTEPGPDKPLGSCPRRDPIDVYNDWYTLEGCRNIDICPSCYEGTFAGTQFAPFFRQSRLYETPVPRACDFASAWLRLAWLLTLKQKRNRPDLLYNIATVFETEKGCPGEREETGPWYGIADPRDGIHVNNFTICPCDLRNIEALFPSLRGYFTRYQPQVRNPQMHKCSLRTSSHRFSQYLNLLVEIDNEAQERKRAPDMAPFMQLVREYAWKKECPKDETMMYKPWHFIPGLSEFTACEECYEEVILPAMQAGSRLASRCNRTLQPVPNEGSEGSSCCLYTPHMRRVWQRAVEDEDFEYLKRKAVERKRERGRLAREMAALQRLMVSKTALGRSNEEWKSLKTAMRNVDEEWKALE